MFAVSPDLVMINDQARELIDPADQVTLIAGATEAMNSGRRLTAGRPAQRGGRARARAAELDRARRRGRRAAGAAGRARRAARPRGRAVRAGAALPAAVGSGLLWAKCCQAVDRHFQSREWLVLEGEPGTGKTTHRPRHPPDAAPPPRTCGCSTPTTTAPAGSPTSSRSWRPAAARWCSPTSTGCRPRRRQALADALEPYRESTDPERPWVVATVDAGGAAARARRPAGVFPRTVEVPPLRHHVEDVAELVPHLIARLTRGAELTCSPEAMRVLMRNRWPGNVEQLYQVLRKTVARRRAGVLVPADLPPEARAITRRVLTPLEAIECDAIVDALLDNNGNKAEAARTWACPAPRSTARSAATASPRRRRASGLRAGPGAARPCELGSWASAGGRRATAKRLSPPRGC